MINQLTGQVTIWTNSWSKYSSNKPKSLVDSNKRTGRSWTCYGVITTGGAIGTVSEYSWHWAHRSGLVAEGLSTR